MFEFDDDVVEHMDHRREFDKDPVLVCWYSGGFYSKEGNELLAPLKAAAEEVGIKDVLVLDFPDAYGMVKEGRDPWPKYVDRLIQEIDREPARRGRPLLLFGHSRGASPAMSVATRLMKDGRSDQVLKVYVAACTHVSPNEPTGWELTSAYLKAGTDKEMFEYFRDQQPGHPLLQKLANSSPEEINEFCEMSEKCRDMRNLYKVQYRDAMYPDTRRDIMKINVPIMAISPMQSPFETPDAMKEWEKFAGNGFEVLSIEGDHMGCIADQQRLRDTVCADMAEVAERGVERR